MEAPIESFERLLKCRLPERITSKIQFGGEDDCWPWLGALSSGYRYGHCWWNGKVEYVHVIVYEVVFSSEHLNILHSCDYGLCGNPKHLRSGTQLENIREAVEKGRMGGPSPIRRFSKDDVRTIRASYMTDTELAERFSTTPGNIWYIRHRVTYKDVD